MAARPRTFNVTTPNLYCKLDKRTNKVYWQYKDPVSGRFTGFGTDADAARTAAIELNRIYAEREANQAFELLKIRAQKQGMGKAVLLPDWVKTYVDITERRHEKGEISKATVDVRKTHAIRLASRFPRTPLDAVSARDLSAIITEYTDRDKNRMAQAVRSVWSDMFKEAQYAGAVDPGFNPAEATRKPKAKVTRQRLTLEDWNKVFNAATASHLRNAMLLAMVTGQRVGDIAKMKFTDVKNGMLYVEQGKGGARVAIPLNIRSEALGMTLGDVIAGCRDRAVSRYLVHHSRRIGAANVGDALPAKALTNLFSAVRDRVVIELDEGKTPPTFHEQRSLSGRLYEKQGINVQALWGHKSKKMSELYLDERNTEWIVVAV